ncbi:endolytic transglycosylase MltG [Chloroflexota bacterium]
MLFLILLLCALAILVVWNLNSTISHTQAAFGPASPDLELSQKLILSWRLLQTEEILTSPADPFGNDIQFQISLGESPSSVAGRLEAAGLVHDARSFRDFLVYAGLDTQIQAGVYVLNPATSAIQIAYILQDATPSEVPFAVLAGWRLEEVAESLPHSGLSISPEIFLREAQNQNLEGYLLPGIYTVPRTISAKGLLDILTSTFDDTLTSELKAGFTNQGLTLDDAVRLASIVEREAIVEDEKPLIASVFLNRLADGMKLEADPTVQYAVGFNENQDTWWTNPLSAADLKTDSFYNTYQYSGLPPSAICNPSLESLKAVAFAAQTPYYYFRAACDDSGKHNFAENFEEHIGNECP